MTDDVSARSGGAVAAADAGDRVDHVADCDDGDDDVRSWSRVEALARQEKLFAALRMADQLKRREGVGSGDRDDDDARAHVLAGVRHRVAELERVRGELDRVGADWACVHTGACTVHYKYEQSPQVQQAQAAVPVEGDSRASDAAGEQASAQHGTPASQHAKHVHRLRVEGEIDVPLLWLLAVINETDLYGQWVPFMQHADRVAQLSRFQQVAALQIKLPWPFAPRDCVLYGYGIDALEERAHGGESAVYVVARSVQPEAACDAHLPFPARRSADAVRIDIHAAFRLVPLGPHRCRMALVADCDPLMRFVPRWLLDLVTRKFAHLAFSVLARTARGVPGGVYEARMAANADTYAELCDRLHRAGHLDPASVPPALAEHWDACT